MTWILLISFIIYAVVDIYLTLLLTREISKRNHRREFTEQLSPGLNPEDHEILEFRDGAGWCHHSWRHVDHPDLAIYGKHPRFNVKRPDGTLWRSE